MADRFDVAQALAGASGERAQVWEFAKEFAASWATPLSLGDGFVPAEVCRAEERLGRRVPVALHEAYALFGRRSDLVAHHNPLLPPDELLLDPSGQLLVFRSENQGCAGWCVPLDQLSADDPPVVFFSDYLPDLVWEPFMPSLSLACAETILSETVMGRRYGPTGRDCVATPEVLSGVEDQFEPVGLPGTRPGTLLENLRSGGSPQRASCCVWSPETRDRIWSSLAGQRATCWRYCRRSPVSGLIRRTRPAERNRRSSTTWFCRSDRFGRQVIAMDDGPAASARHQRTGTATSSVAGEAVFGVSAVLSAVSSSSPSSRLSEVQRRRVKPKK